ncbi:MAG: hypothetical protein PHT84_00425 [Candidatus Pacebacteria bacterium]|nr:hypothetical protein [Candidatus Paceibacterota bacterium]
MSEEEILALAQKVKDGSVTEEELGNFTEEYTKIVSYLNEEIKKEEENN